MRPRGLEPADIAAVASGGIVDVPDDADELDTTGAALAATSSEAASSPDEPRRSGAGDQPREGNDPEARRKPPARSVMDGPSQRVGSARPAV